MINKIIYMLGVKYRNPHLNTYLDFLKNSDTWDYNMLLEYQFLKFKDLLTFAYKYSEFYKSRLDELSLNLGDFTSISDIRKLPITTKLDLIEFNEQIHTKYTFDKKFFSETSGTSGQVLKFYRNEEWDSHNRAAMFRGYSWYGIQPWDLNGYFWGYNLDSKKQLKTKLLDYLQNRFRIFSYNKQEIIAFTRKLANAKYLHGYSSMIYEVAKEVNKLELQKEFSLKMIKGTSEKIYDNYHDEVRKAFGLKIISEYGSAESGIIAFECPYGSMHITMENVIVEEENGEIIVTNLLSKSFPIIRYKLGDSIKFADANFKCKCGRAHPVILDIIGRIGKKVYGKKLSYPSLTFYYVFKNIAMNYGLNLNYQVHQDIKGYIRILIEQDQLLDMSLLHRELTKYFSDDIDYEIAFNQKLHCFDGKLKDFITTID